MAGKQLVQGYFAVTWAGVEPAIFQLQGRTLSTEARRHQLPICSTDLVHRFCTSFEELKTSLNDRK